MSPRNMKIATRAGLGFAILALLVALVGGFSLLQMKRMNGTALRWAQASCASARPPCAWW